MKRYLAASAAFIVVYAVSCFTAWEFPLDFSDWSWFGRLYFALASIFFVGMTWTWPGWTSRP